jgi:hypothetical protein
MEVGDGCFDIFFADDALLDEMLACYKLLGCLGMKQNPPFSALERSIPSGGHVGVNMA